MDFNKEYSYYYTQAHLLSLDYWTASQSGYIWQFTFSIVE